MKKVKITQIKSAIGYRQKTKNTMIALGLRKINHSVIKNLDGSIKGMIDKVSHLVKIEAHKWN